jgi:uncharacterized protein YjbJ (UPF0337 family)
MKAPFSNTAEDTQRRYSRNCYSQPFATRRNHRVNDRFTLRVPQIRSYDRGKDKAAGVANEAIGKAKQGIGNAVGSDRMKADGATQELKGDAQKAAGDAKNATKEMQRL